MPAPRLSSQKGWVPFRAQNQLSIKSLRDGTELSFFVLTGKGVLSFYGQAKARMAKGGNKTGNAGQNGSSI